MQTEKRRKCRLAEVVKDILAMDPKDLSMVEQESSTLYKEMFGFMNIILVTISRLPLYKGVFEFVISILVMVHRLSLYKGIFDFMNGILDTTNILPLYK